MTKEERFFNALRDVFVGAKVDGESGFINLMKIKSRYYTEGVFPHLQKDIDKALKPFPIFREELFDKLYDFFRRYFSESGSIYFRHTPLHQNVYEKVYTDDKDVMLFWKTHMLYYVKTDKLFKSLDVELDRRKFFFDASALEHKRANEKRVVVYAFKEKRKDGTIAFTTAYSERGKQTKFEELLRALNKAGVKVGEDDLRHAFRVFERQSEVDYFINKDAKAFLEEQFNLWMYQYVFSGSSDWAAERIQQLQVLRAIAYKIIAFISQFEDELVMIWNKPKFVLDSNYVITTDRIAGKDGGVEVLKKLSSHKGFAAQLDEWKELGIVSDNVKQSKWKWDDAGAPLGQKLPKLPIDTKHFKDIEVDVLTLFDNLDAELDGRLINGENYQALRTLLPKFKDEVQLAYIDPPYNTEKESFSYKDRFNRSSWTTMVDNRIELAHQLLRDTGSIYVQVDFHETASTRLILDKTFGEDNFLNEIVWRIGWVSGFKTAGEKYVRNHDTIWFYRKSSKALFHGDQLNKPYKSVKLSNDQKRLLKSFVESIKKETGIRPNKVEWIITGDDGTLIKDASRGEGKDGTYPTEDVWNASEYDELNSIMIMSYSDEKVGDFLTQKPEKLVRRMIEASSEKGDTVLDFYVGSGTTSATAQKLGRKWIAVEMADYFYTKALPRMKEVLAGAGTHEPCGISNDVSWRGGGFFKYYRLEQYEDVLRRTAYVDADLFNDPNTDPYHQYAFLRDKKMLQAVTIDKKKNKVTVDLDKLYPNIDIAETLSNLSGTGVKRITADSVEFTDGVIVDIKSLDWERIKPLIWW